VDRDGAPTELLRDGDLAARFAALDGWLVAHRELWHPRPFLQQPVPWADRHPALARWLVGRAEDEIDAIDAAAAGFGPAPELPAVMERWRREAATLSAVGRWPAPSDPDRLLQRRACLGHGVRARKWGQVEAFAGALLPLSARSTRLVDWCGGQGHLGRTLAVLSGRPVTIVDRDEGLGPRALDLARRAGVQAAFATADALLPAARAHLQPGCAAVALHACGGLSIALIDGLSPEVVPDVALAPCCFHLAHGDGDGRRPLSAAGRAAALDLDHTALRLATLDEGLAKPSRRALRRRESAWRLGLDLLLREATGADRYSPLGPLDPAALSLPFEDFCRTVAADRGLRLPASWSPVAACGAGEGRAKQARALASVRALFRRPLELWLVLDRALALADRGYAVGVGAFCDARVTPRNLLIRATAG
jgi:hypothetical protein